MAAPAELFAAIRNGTTLKKGLVSTRPPPIDVRSALLFHISKGMELRKHVAPAVETRPVVAVEFAKDIIDIPLVVKAISSSPAEVAAVAPSSTIESDQYYRM